MSTIYYKIDQNTRVFKIKSETEITLNEFKHIANRHNYLFLRVISDDWHTSFDPIEDDEKLFGVVELYLLTVTWNQINDISNQLALARLEKAISKGHVTVRMKLYSSESSNVRNVSSDIITSVLENLTEKKNADRKSLYESVLIRNFSSCMNINV